MSKSKQSNPATIARKQKNALANLARSERNRNTVAVLGLKPQESIHTKTSVGRDGKPREFTVVKDVRASKLLRSDRRAVQRLLSTRTASAIHKASETLPKVAEAMADLGTAMTAASVAGTNLSKAYAANQ